jgi:hypothetical protein
MFLEELKSEETLSTKEKSSSKKRMFDKFNKPHKDVYSNPSSMASSANLEMTKAQEESFYKMRNEISSL